MDLAEHQMRRVEPAEPVDTRQQIVGDAMHDLLDLAVNIGVQPAEIGHPGGGAHAAEKSVAFDQQDTPAMLPRGGGGREPGRSAAEHDDVTRPQPAFSVPARSGAKALQPLNNIHAAGGCIGGPHRLYCAAPHGVMRRASGIWACQSSF